MSESETEKAVRDIVRKQFGVGADYLRHMAFGHGSVTYSAVIGDLETIIRTNSRHDAYDGTLRNIEQLRALGIPVPTVVAADLSTSHYPFVYMITESFPGTDLRDELGSMTRSQMSTLAEQIVGFERATSTLAQGNGFGFVPIDAPGTHRSWYGVIVDDFQGNEGNRALSTVVDAALAAAESRLESVRPVCFLDDLTIKNVIVHHGSLTGVVDFDVVCYGDPIYWIALTQVSILSDIPSGQFYTDELIRLWQPHDEDLTNLALYSALHATTFLSHSSGHRASRLRESISRWIDTASS